MSTSFQKACSVSSDASKEACAHAVVIGSADAGVILASVALAEAQLAQALAVREVGVALAGSISELARAMRR